MSGIRMIRKLKSWLEGGSSEIGWYSEKQRNISWRDDKPCAHVYLTPEGKEVLVTEVTMGLTTSSKWDDIKMIGPVDKWVRSIYSMHKTKF